ncbi:MAG: META domain-containing protein [Rhodospirillaceae bacterium]|nr:META domain-containing protein [Rhodospirillaceae bacterium]
MRLPSSLVLPLLVLVASCAADRPEQAEIVGPVWVAETIAGAPVIPGTVVTLKLDPEGRSGGKAGCNSYGAGYQRDGGTLSFEQAFSTKMFCSPDALMAQEQAYLDLLSRIAAYQTQGDKLLLNATDGKTIVFHQQP